MTQRIEAQEMIPWWALAAVANDLTQAICHVRRRALDIEFVLPRGFHVICICLVLRCIPRVTSERTSVPPIELVPVHASLRAGVACL